MKKFKKGFTLIELLVVISVIGLLAALIMVNFNSARERARDVQRKSDLDQTKKALRMYYNDNNSYPDDNDGRIHVCGNPPTSILEWGVSQFACDSMVYMRLLPQDPVVGQSYSYSQGADNQDFCLTATLENRSDADIANSQVRCSACGGAETTYVVCAD
jgi:general secretion pathway protein G